MRFLGWDIKKARKPSIEVRDLSKVRLEKEDILVIHCNHRISSDVADEIQKSVKSVFGSSREVIVLDEGLRLSVISIGGDSFEPASE